MANAIPLVPGSSGLSQQLQSGDTLTDSAGVAFQKKDEKDANSGYLGLTSNNSIDRPTPVTALNTRARNVFHGGIAIDSVLTSGYSYGSNTTLFGLDHADQIDDVIIIDASTNNVVLTLPPTDNCRHDPGGGAVYGQSINFKFRRVDTNRAKTCTIQVAPSVGDYFEVSLGATSISLLPGETVVLHCSALISHHIWYQISQPNGGVMDRIATNIERENSVYRSILPAHATPLLMISATAYFVYLGRTTAIQTPKFVEFYLSTLATGTTEAGEVGFFSTPAAPNKASQSLTKLVSTGTIDTTKVGLGVKRNTSAFATAVAANTHLWAGIRYAMVTGTVAQPTVLSLGYDFAQGHILSLASAGVLTGAGPFTGSIITASANQQCPMLSGSLI